MSDFPESDLDGPDPLDDAPASPAPVADEPEFDPEIVAKAREHGWKPREEYPYNPRAWTDPEKFLESPKTQVKILRKELEAAKASEAERDKRLAAIEGTTRAALNSARAQERARFDAELARINEEKRAAVEEQDLQRYDAAHERETAIKQQAASPQQLPPDVQEYIAKADWMKDPELYAVAHAIVEASPGVKAMPFMKQFEHVEKRMKALYPEKFDAPDPKPAAPQHSKVDGGGMAPAGKRKTYISDLPAEAQAAFKMFQAEGVKITADDYIRSYLGDEA